jgi:hypothetical protein
MPNLSASCLYPDDGPERKPLRAATARTSRQILSWHKICEFGLSCKYAHAGGNWRSEEES